MFSLHPGKTKSFWTCTNRKDTQSYLDYFLDKKIENFGDYEDAVDQRDNILFHSSLSPQINLGLLTPEEIISKIKKANRLAMADCSNLDDAKNAILEGADIIGTTLAGYVGKQVKDTDKPNIKLIKEFKKLNCFVMAEGRYNTPELAKQAIQAGADAVTIGSAITRIDNITSWFVKKIKN